ncbi:Crp/Fnr family transcriptional regulator [Ancylomarina sp. 16SWW S1-10-2]|uniref:Crp/Fnr family transcriptional regulator n=1 Tax=Ancylomarina sp. 16SWW S1-10-2 TaxID=2499681 RepID=UPI0012AD231E|nr:Crp/Fnr family transcriptional regulator [Ancylomarina sp. 16SWW S1-10-2]MRT94546.1 Crp/Fnr family transcriptional regulator [Ancylomarina sp. 16SWW S1-10-2]
MIESDKKIREQVCLEVINNPNSIFNFLSQEEKENLRDNMTCSFFKKGEFIYKEGEKPLGLISLKQGKVKIFKEGVGGREQIIRMAKPIGFIGYRALFAEENNIVSAIAIEDCVTCTVSYDMILKLIKTNPEISLSIIRSFAAELGFSNSRTVTLTQKHIRGRLAESLLFLRDTYGFEDDEKTIKVYLSREDIANLSNMTTSNAIRTLSTFAGEDVIAIDGRKIKILDKVKLDRISKLG